MNRQRGASKFEFAVTVAILGFLAAVLLVRLTAIEAEAERTEVDLTVRNIRVGIQLAISERIMRGEEERIREVAQASPIDFAVDYAGDRPQSFSAGRFPEAPGQWAYDPARRELAYRPRMPEAFDGIAELHWRYVARFDSSGKAVGVTLVRLN